MSSSALANLRPETPAPSSTASTSATATVGSTIDRRGTYPIPTPTSKSSAGASSSATDGQLHGLARSATAGRLPASSPPQFAPPPPRPRHNVQRADTPLSYSDSQDPSPSSSDGEDDDVTGPETSNNSGRNGSVIPEGNHHADAGTASSTQSFSGAAGSGHAEVKKPRACEACRGLKVRCDMDPNAPPETPCRRCAKAGRQCIVTQPTRRRQKKTDSRVAELEKKIDALTASLQLTRQAGISGAGGTAASGTNALPHTSGPPATSIAAQPTSYSASGIARSPYPTAPPPMVMAGQKRKFSEMREASGVVAAGSGSGGAGSRAGSFAGSRSGSVIGDESPSSRDPLHAASHHHYHGHAPAQSQAYSQQSPSQQTTPRQQQQQQQPPQPQSQSTPQSYMSSAQGSAEYADVVDRGLITMGQAVELFQRYNERMVRHMPSVVFPPGTTAAEIRKTKPILFLALMAAASSEMHVTQRALVRELMQIFADRIVVVGEKSLELVQALQVAVVWYWPPEHFEELKFYQLVHMAAVMAIEIGLGRRRPANASASSNVGNGSVMFGKFGNPTAMPYDAANNASPSTESTSRTPLFAVPRSQKLQWRDHPFKKHPLPDPCSVESRRAWLACYFMTSNTSMALHRPNLLRWSSFMTESVDVLEKSPDAAPTDQYLCHLVWTHRLSEEVGMQFSMDDPMTMISISDSRTQYSLRGFEREMARYKASIPQSMLQPSLRMSFEVLNLYMHEIALQNEGGSEESFHPSYANGEPPESLVSDATLTAAHISALSSCLQAIDGIFDAFLGLDIDSLRCVPVFTFVRVAYAMVVLIKLYFAASAPNSELGKIIDKDNMKVEQHLNALLEKFRSTATDNKSRPAAKFLIVLVMVRSWFYKQRQVALAAQAAAAQAEKVSASGEASRTRSEQTLHDVLNQDDHPTRRKTGSSEDADTERSQQQSPANAAATASASTVAAQDAQPTYLPSSTFLSTGRTPVMPAAVPAQISSPSVLSGSASAVSMGSPAPVVYAANTPLELLSEIAANDQAATAAAQAAQQQQQQQQHMAAQNPMPWFNSGSVQETAPGFVNPGAAAAVNGTGAPPPPGAVAGTLQPGGVANTPGMDYFTYPGLNLGDNFEYALDLTLGGLPGGAGNGLEGMDFSEGMPSLMTDPWFVAPGEFQF